MPLDSNLATLDSPQLPLGQPMKILCPSIETTTRVPYAPLCRNVQNPHAREAHDYNFIDDLYQSPFTMSML
jgi:hypothetical protein